MNIGNIIAVLLVLILLFFIFTPKSPSTMDFIPADVPHRRHRGHHHHHHRRRHHRESFSGATSNAIVGHTPHPKTKKTHLVKHPWKKLARKLKKWKRHHQPIIIKPTTAPATHMAPEYLPGSEARGQPAGLRPDHDYHHHHPGPGNRHYRKGPYYHKHDYDNYRYYPHENRWYYRNDHDHDWYPHEDWRHDRRRRREDRRRRREDRRRWRRDHRDIGGDPATFGPPNTVPGGHMTPEEPLPVHIDPHLLPTHTPHPHDHAGVIPFW